MIMLRLLNNRIRFTKHKSAQISSTFERAGTNCLTDVCKKAAEKAHFQKLPDNDEQWR